jgi:hypothetical protein
MFSYKIFLKYMTNLHTALILYIQLHSENVNNEDLGNESMVITKTIK